MYLVYFIIGINMIASLYGFKNEFFLEKFMFKTDKILQNKEYYRLVTSAFIHNDLSHLGFNLFSFYSFGRILEIELGFFPFLIIYLVSLIASELFSLYVHRINPNYRALGASGAISGVIFSFIVFFPDTKMSVFFIPGIPAWLFGIVYTLISIYGLQSGAGRIGHSAHLGGGIAGVLVTLAMYPFLIFESSYVIAGILIPFVIFTIILLIQPNFFNKIKSLE
ncbi:MAG: rhomboid family intramembrane serine protease [Chlorobiota bacterium]|nr:rhomboid family intramembrane serine protease [Chlorobiota bacterium]QQS65484.1 MAG: rhomboid family intramembrane serine protease [Chlorobiota bacterium]